MKINALCVYCGSSPGVLPQYVESARSFGVFLAEKSITLVYGGGNVGLMGAVADGCLHAGGKVIGVIPQSLVAKEVAHRGVTELRIVASMHERKLMMADLADGFVALPGGFGTLDEIFEMITWSQLGIHGKPCAFLNVAGFYDPLFAFLEQAVDHCFVRTEHLDSILIETDHEKLLARFQSYVPKRLDKWIDRQPNPSVS